MFVAYLALLVWAPIPLGSNRPWSMAVLEAGALLLASAWLLRVLLSDQPLPSMLTSARPVLVVLALWVSYVWAQLIPLPMDLLEMLSPRAAAAYLEAARPAERAFAPISLDTHATLDAACRTTAFAAFFVLSLVLLTTRRRIRAAAITLVVSGLLQATYGAGFASIGDARIVTGTFVNQNHFGAYLVMCLSVGIGLLIASLSGAQHASWSEFFRSLLLWAINSRLALRLALMVMVIALVMTRSRMGNSSFFISLLVAGVIGLVLSKYATRSTVLLLASLIAIDLLIVGTYFGAEQVVQRLASSTSETEDRDEVAGYAISMWKDYPAFGSGLGSFVSVFPRYSGEGTIGTYTHAHNDYVEFAAEAGLVGLALIGIVVLLSFLAALRAQALRHDPLMRGISFGAIMSIIAMMMHSAVDFSLQIPANALTFMLILAFAWIARFHKHNGARHMPSTEKLPS